MTHTSRDLQALTLHAPWPTCIWHHGKRGENRTWKPSLWQIERGGHPRPVAIHTAKTFHRDSFMDAVSVLGLANDNGKYTVEKHPRHAGKELLGQITGLVLFNGIVKYTGYQGYGRWSFCHHSNPNKPVTNEDLIADRFAFGPYYWLIGRKYVLPEPIPATGSQRFWYVKPEARTAIIEQLKAEQEDAETAAYFLDLI